MFMDGLSLALLQRQTLLDVHLQFFFGVDEWCYVCCALQLCCKTSRLTSQFFAAEPGHLEKANATVENRILLLAPACAYSMWTIASHCFIIPGTRTCLLHFSMHALPIAGIIEDFDQRGRCSELNRAMILGRLPSYMNLGLGIFVSLVASVFFPLSLLSLSC